MRCFAPEILKEFIALSKRMKQLLGVELITIYVMMIMIVNLASNAALLAVSINVLSLKSSKLQLVCIQLAYQ